MRVAVLAFTLGLFTIALPAAAQEEPPKEDAPGGSGACAPPLAGDGPRGFAIELNVLWPFFPGGITELRGLVPLVRTDKRDFRGELVVGVYSDFASHVIRDETHGKVANYSGKLGWRQFLVHGLHVEVGANAGWRHETQRPPDNVTIDAFQVRLWTLAGYQHEISRVLYVNARGGVGIHVYRSDEYAHLERKLAPGGDVNFGVRF